jgi:hypothetical protein
VIDGVGICRQRYTAGDGEIARCPREKIGVHLARTTSGQVQIDPAAKSAEIRLALADDSATSRVAAGENKGRQLHHVAILRSLRKIGSVSGVPPSNKVSRCRRAPAA